MLAKLPWLISQYWSHLAFLNYSVSIDELSEMLPQNFEVDTFEGKAYLSIVPFKMSQIRLIFSPSLPIFSLWELNIRTYIKVNGIPGIYFFTLDTNHSFAAWIARKFFALPYRKMALKGIENGENLSYISPNLTFDAVIKEEITKGIFESWICERYHLFTQKNKMTLKGTAIHEPWRLAKLEINKLDQDFLRSFNFCTAGFVGGFAGLPLNVKFKSFEILEEVVSSSGQAI